MQRRTEDEPIQGFTVVRLHWSADEEKDEAWARKIRADLPTEDWLREYELISTGRDKEHPVYSDWKRDLHERSLRYDSRHPVIFRGWDFGKVHPAVVWVQLTNGEINILHELLGNEIQLEQFTYQVLQKSSLWFPGAVKYVDWVDPHGEAEKDDGRSSIRVLRDCGIHPKYHHQEVEPGILTVGKQLVRLEHGRPRLCADPKECPITCDTMRGGYKRNKRGLIVKDGYYEHIADAIRYVVVGIVKSIGEGGGPNIHIKKAKEYVYRPNNVYTGY